MALRGLAECFREAEDEEKERNDFGRAPPLLAAFMAH